MRRTRLLALLTGLGLAVAALGPAPAAGAADTGRLHIEQLDEHGDPMPGSIQVVDAAGGYEAEHRAHTRELELPPGSYGVTTISPWGGILCAGIEPPCDATGLSGGGGGLEPDGSVEVVVGQVTDVVLRADAPVAVAGAGVVGRPLSLDWSTGMQRLVDYFGTFGGGVYLPTVQWQRDGRPIDGATDETYTPTGVDAGSTISASVAYSAFAQEMWGNVTGTPVAPRETDGVAVAKVRTTAFANLADPTVRADRRGRVRVDVTARGLVVTGKVRVRVGDWARTLKLRNGTARTVLPRLSAGRHPVRASYLGTAVFRPSTAKAKVLTVSR